jgi:hypothetical protein
VGAGGGTVNGGQERVDRGALRDGGVGLGDGGRDGEDVVDVCRVQDHGRAVVGLLLDPEARRQAVVRAERVVEDHDVGSQVAHGSQQVDPVGQRADALDRGLVAQQALEAGAQGGVVVDDEDADGAPRRGCRCSGHGFDAARAGGGRPWVTTRITRARGSRRTGSRLPNRLRAR